MSLKPKAALIKDGKVPTTLGRGRMSAAQISRVQELVAAGWDIEGYPPPKSTGAVIAEKVVRVAEPTVKVVVDPVPERHDERTMTPYVNHKGKRSRVGKREVCVTCRNSLTHCGCGDPRVHVDLGRAVAPVWWERD